MLSSRIMRGIHERGRLTRIGAGYSGSFALVGLDIAGAVILPAPGLWGLNVGDEEVIGGNALFRGHGRQEV